MKKYIRILVLALALSSLLCMSVFAAGTIDEVSKTDDPEAANVTIENQANLKGEDKLALSYDGGVENAGAMYLLLVLDDTGYQNDGVPTAGNIKYVNQATANAQGVATFESVYPSDITKSTIYLAGGDLGGLTDIVNIDPETPAGYNVTGSIISYLDAAGDVTVELFTGGSGVAAYSAKTNTGAYSMVNVANGTYTMKVSKTNHVTREYEITVSSAAVAQDVKIHPVGDITGDGKINVSDYGKALRHAKKYESLTGYEFDCGNVNGDDKINVSDYGKLLRHAKKYEYLW